MKKIIVLAAFAALGAPAFAQTTTLQEVTTKGIVLQVAGMDIDVTYKPDGTFTVQNSRNNFSRTYAPRPR